MSVLVEFSMFPTDKGESVSEYVSRIIKMMKESGLNYKLTAMGTVFETEEMEEALKILAEAYKELAPDCKRVYSAVKFDIRKGQSNRLQSKPDSIEEKIGKVQR